MSQQSYEQMVQRVQRKISSPGAQKEHCAELQKLDDESSSDWERMLDELGTVENVTIITLYDTNEHIRIRWNPEESMA